MAELKNTHMKSGMFSRQHCAQNDSSISASSQKNSAHSYCNRYLFTRNSNHQIVESSKHFSIHFRARNKLEKSKSDISGDNLTNLLGSSSNDLVYCTTQLDVLDDNNNDDGNNHNNFRENLFIASSLFIVGTIENGAVHKQQTINARTVLIHCEYEMKIITNPTIRFYIHLILLATNKATIIIIIEII